MNWRVLQRLLLCAVAAFSFAAIPSFAWWYILDSRDAPPSTFQVDIPAGTADEIAAGAQPPSLPKTLRLAAGSSLLIRNLDVVNHQIGPVIIPAGAEKTVPAGMFVSAGQDRFVCSFHSAGTIGLTTVGKSTPAGALLVSLLVAAPLTLASFGVVSVTDRLKVGAG